MGFLRGLRVLWILFILFGMGIVGLQSGLHKRHLAEEQKRNFAAPITMTLEEFVHSQPTRGWFHLTGVTTAAIDAVSRQGDPKKFMDHGDGTGTVEKVMVPIQDAVAAAIDGPAHVVLLTDNLRIRKVVNEMNKIGLNKTIKVSRFGTIKDSSSEDETSTSANEDTDENEKPNPPVDKVAIKKWASKNLNRIFETRTVEGMIRAPEDLDLDDSTMLTALQKDLAPRCVILEEGVTPKTQDAGGFEIGLATICLLIGSSIVLFFVGSILVGVRVSAADRQARTPRIEVRNETYTVNDAEGRRHQGVSEATLRAWNSEGKLPETAVLRNEATGEIYPLSRILARLKRP